MESQLPVIFIVGPTASGKSELALQIAEQYFGEIICSDSRTVYKGMDIGTAKPSAHERARVPHWGLDLVETNERFTVAQFQKYAKEKIGDIRSRGHIPIVVGGSGLYIDAVLFDYRFEKPMYTAQHKKYDDLSITDLQNLLESKQIPLPFNAKNRRHLISKLLSGGVESSRSEKPIANSIIVGITTDVTVLESRIRGRSEKLFDEGIVEESLKLAKTYGWDHEAMSGNAYRVVKEYAAGSITKAEFVERNVVLDRQLAKRQLTWFRRNSYIQWMSLDDAHDFLKTSLADLIQA